MKLRDSGMPEEGYWETLFDVSAVTDRLGIDGGIGDAVELGCGYGTFTLPVAGKITGILRTFDIDPEMVASTRQRAVSAGLTNIVAGVRDVFAEGFGISDASQDACLLFNILHCEERRRLHVEAARVLKDGGKLLVIHWRPDPATPRGPAMDIRPTPQQIGDWVLATGLFDHVLIVTTLCFVESPARMLAEAGRVLKPGGRLVLGFIDRDSALGRRCEADRETSVFYQSAKFHSVADVQCLLRNADLVVASWCQTLTRPLDEITAIEPARPGHGTGGFVVCVSHKPGAYVS